MSTEEIKKGYEMRVYITPPLDKIGVLAMFGNGGNPKVLHGTTVKFPVYKVADVPSLGKVDFEKSLHFTLDTVDKPKAQKLMFEFLSNVFIQGGFEFQGILYAVDKSDYKLMYFDGAQHVDLQNRLNLGVKPRRRRFEAIVNQKGFRAIGQQSVVECDELIKGKIYEEYWFPDTSTIKSKPTGFLLDEVGNQIKLNSRNFGRKFREIVPE